MERADSPHLDHWADRDFQILVQGPSGDLETVYSTAASTDATVTAELAAAIELVSGVLPASDADPTTLLSLIHDGKKFGALCRNTTEPLSDDTLREMVATTIFKAESLDTPDAPVLDPKETAYLKKVTEGLSDAEIAGDLGLSLRAVKERKKRTLVDLNATSIAHAISIATRAGLI